jgi:hypothetical protein
MLIIFNFDQSKNSSIYLNDIINLIWCENMSPIKEQSYIKK